MKACISNRFRLFFLIASLSSILVGRVAAQPAGYLWLYNTVNFSYVFQKFNPSNGALLQTITVPESTIIGGQFSAGGGYLWLYNTVGRANLFL